MGTSQYISLKDAALLTDRSPQTIRRLIKANKTRYRKYKTPQGFTYLVEKTSLLNHFSEEDEMNEAELVEEFDPANGLAEITEIEPDFTMPTDMSHREHMTSQPAHSISYAPTPSKSPGPRISPDSLNSGVSPGAQTIINELIRQHRDDKNRLFELLETFQTRILTLEEQIKLLEAPQQKRPWYHFFKG